MRTRRDVLATAGASTVGAAAWPAVTPASAVTAAASFRFACPTLPWVDDCVTGVADVARAGFHGVQSSNNIALAPEREAATMALHEKNALFVAAAGGQFLQVTDERPQERTPTSEDRQRLGGLLTTPGRRPAPLGVKVVYHSLPGAFGALSEVGYRGWVIVELDAVPDRGGSASASMLTSKRYIEQVLKLTL
jgi:hypothetical protein